MVQRNHPAETVCGDAWTVDWVGSCCRVAVIDGLGHGPAAAEAARAAVLRLEQDASLDPAAALLACHHALKGTRGAAATIAAIDLSATRLTYAGVGNVEGRLVTPGGDERLVAFRGIVGGHHLHLRPLSLDLVEPWTFILHTDGVSARFDTDDVPELESGDPSQVASAILERYGRDHDDATVVVLKSGQASDVAPAREATRG
ncbi:MAG TPA: SpoIIE family protein phosphatase [Thermomicrobiaceae bacterium]|nr:SpoIIE family protein phosphatase [Thermomicrobiaceae bacterium]